MVSWRISEALTSVRRLLAVSGQMTEEELIQAINLEEASGRRKSLLTLLYRQHRALSRKTQAVRVKAQADDIF